MQLNRDRRRREKANAIRFKSLIATPAESPFVMPAGATLYLLSRDGCAEGTTSVTYETSSGVRTVKAPLLAAGESYSIGYVEKGITVGPNSGFTVLIATGLDNRKAIAVIPGGF